MLIGMSDRWVQAAAMAGFVLVFAALFAVGIALHYAGPTVVRGLQWAAMLASDAVRGATRRRGRA